jgi:trimeric autotransporter adhesin
VLAPVSRLAFVVARGFFVAVSISVAWSLVATASASAGTYTVASTADTADPTPNDTTCDTGSGGPCTLRAAIQTAMGTGSAGADTIQFAIAGGGVHTIAPSTQLPDVADQTTIDGSSQPGWAAGSEVIELDGESAPSGANGLQLTGTATVDALAINRFTGAGIQTTAGGYTITRSDIGTSADGTSCLGNGNGIIGTGTGTIGGSTAASGNVIACNTGSGVRLDGPDTANPTVAHNYIGLLSNGIAGSGQAFGVAVYGGSASVGLANVISGNSAAGVVAGAHPVDPQCQQLAPPCAWVFSHGVGIQGNLIGIDPTGTQARPNGDGVRIVGNEQVVQDNSIAGNTGDGIHIFGPTNAGTGLRFQDFIKYNEIGVATPNPQSLNGLGSTGGTPMGNGDNGVTIESTPLGAASGNQFPDNRIENNGHSGIRVLPGAGGSPDPTGNFLEANGFAGNGGLAIDLGATGEDVNDALDADSGANGLQNHPVMTGATSTTASGSLSSTPNRTFSIMLHHASSCDPSGFGEGTTLGQVEVTTDGSGNASFSVNLQSALPPGEVVTATATDLTTLDTSEMSNCAATPGPPPPSGGSGSPPPSGGSGSPPPSVHCVVPKLAGKTLSAARKALGRAHCAVGKITKKESRKRTGTVLASKPRAGTRLASGARVRLVVAG